MAEEIALTGTNELAQIFKATPKLFWLCRARRAMQSSRATGSLCATQSSHATQSLQSHA